MRESGYKREIESVCEIWEGGLVGYLTWKLRKVLGLDQETIEIGVEQDNILFDERRPRCKEDIPTDKDLSGPDSMDGNNDSETAETDLLMPNEMQDLVLLKTKLEGETILPSIDDEDKENQYFEDFRTEDILHLEDMDLAFMDIDMIRDF